MQKMYLRLTCVALWLGDAISTGAMVVMTLPYFPCCEARSSQLVLQLGPKQDFTTGEGI